MATTKLLMTIVVASYATVIMVLGMDAFLMVAAEYFLRRVWGLFLPFLTEDQTCSPASSFRPRLAGKSRLNRIQPIVLLPLTGRLLHRPLWGVM